MTAADGPDDHTGLDPASKQTPKQLVGYCDRWSLRAGEAVSLLASATTFGDDMLRTKEEFGGSVYFERPDPNVRADMVFFETQGGGCVGWRLVAVAVE